MKALSIRQPYASLILGIVRSIEIPGIKDVENRTRRTLHRGPLLIHASCTVMEGSDLHHGVNLADCPRGFILGRVDVIDCRYRDVYDRDPSFSPWHGCNCWGWQLANPQPLPAPIPYKGQLGLFNVPDDLIPEGFCP